MRTLILRPVPTLAGELVTHPNCCFQIKGCLRPLQYFSSQTQTISLHEFNLVSLVERLQLLFKALSTFSRTSISEKQISIHSFSVVYLVLGFRGNSLRRGGPDTPPPTPPSCLFQLTCWTTEKFPSPPHSHPPQMSFFKLEEQPLFCESLLNDLNSLAIAARENYLQFPLLVSVSFFQSLLMTISQGIDVN